MYKRQIPNVKTLVHDITTDECRTALKREMQTWKVSIRRWVVRKRWFMGGPAARGKQACNEQPVLAVAGNCLKVPRRRFHLE